jgi:hypothetical protein
MSLFTSMLPSHNRVEDLNEVLSPAIPTLAEVLARHGYHTAGLVNNGQMKAHWGFSRGFDVWREFEVDTPEGNCENLTKEALAWLDSSPRTPFFLFLHYFDIHEPYEAAPPFRERLGVTLSGEETRRLMWEARLPGTEISPPERKEHLVRAYDAEIAWVDHEVGKLLTRVSPRDLVILFSDHGEAFEEHGWTLHGATLYDEEIRCFLGMRCSEGIPRARQVDTPAMLLDVAPTVLGLCGIACPPSFEGIDLRLLWERPDPPARLVRSETKRVIEGRVHKMILLHPWKLIYSLFDGGRDLFRLPDERANVWAAETRVGDPLWRALKEDLVREDYVILHATGTVRHEATVSVPAGKLLLFIPVGFEPGRDDIELLPDQGGLRWVTYPGPQGKGLYLEWAEGTETMRVDVDIAGEKPVEKVAIGPRALHPETIPFELNLGREGLAQSPVIEQAFVPAQDGFHILRYRSPDAKGKRGERAELDEQTLRQLRSLGYVQ